MFSAYILCTRPQPDKNLVVCASYETLEEAEKNVKDANSYIIYPIPLPPPVAK